MRLDQCARPEALLAMCRSHAGAPRSASPVRGPPPGTERLLTRNVTAPAGPAAVEPAAARPHPGGGRRKLPRTKELSAPMREVRGERGRRVPGLGAATRAQAETRRRGHPRGSRSRARPGAADFSAGAALARPPAAL